MMESIEETEILPLNRHTCLQLLERSGEDISDVTVLSFKVNINDTAHSHLSSSRDVFRILIHYERDLEMQHKTMLMKAPLISPYYRILHQFGVYNKEYLLYSQVFPEMRKLDADSFTANFYMGNSELPLIIIEDLYSQGYESTNVVTHELYYKWNYGLCEVFVYLAKMHALSVKLDQMGLIPDQVKIGIEESNMMGESSKNYYTRGIDNFIKYLDPELKSKYDEKLRYLKDNIYDRIVEESEFGIKTLIHGNMWSTNILLKPKEKKVVEKVAFINFENAKWSNPLFDIIHLLITTLSMDGVECQLNFLLDAYAPVINTLSITFGIHLYKREDIDKNLFQCYGYAMWVCGTMAPVLGNADTAINLNKSRFIEDHSWYRDMPTALFKYLLKKGLFED